MALKSEVHPNVSTSDEEDEEEWWIKYLDKIRALEEENRKDFGWRVIQSIPTVDQISEMNWLPVCRKWRSIGESLGISEGVTEEIIHTNGLLRGIYHNSLCDTLCIKAMLIKWLNKDKGTGNSERTWITIAKAVKDVGLGEVVFEFLEEAMKKCVNPYEAQTHYYMQYQRRTRRLVFDHTPTLQELKETIVHHLGEEWRSVGDSLGMSSKVKEEISSKFGSVPTQCSEAMFSKWLNHEEGTGDKERTWGTVLTALEDVGRRDLVISVLGHLIVKHEEESLRAAPNIDDIRVLVVPHVLLMWHVLGLQLGIHKAILSAIESDARRNRSILSKQAIEMFQLWLDGAEGTGDRDRSWSTILRALIKSGGSEVSMQVLKHLDPTATPKDIGQALSQLSENTQSSSDDVATISSDPVPTTSQVTAETSLECQRLSFNDNKVSQHDCTDIEGEVEEDRDALSQLSENTQSSSDDVATISSDPVPTTSTPVPTTSQVTAETSLKCPSFNDNVGQVSLLDCIEDEEVKKDKGCCSKSLSESSGSEVYTDPLPRLGSKRSCSVRDMGESSHATVEESTSTHHSPQFNGDHSTWSEPKRRHLEEGHSREHHPDQLGFSGQKRSPTSGDLEESDLKVTASSEFPAKKNQSKLSKRKRYNKISYNNVPVVIKKLTRKKLRDAVKKMLNGQRIRDLCDDWELIDETCRDIILGLLEKGNKVEAADQLIDYFKDTHTGEELLIFTDFLKEEAGDGGRNQQLLNLAESIEEAVYSASPEDQ